MPDALDTQIARALDEVLGSVRRRPRRLPHHQQVHPMEHLEVSPRRSDDYGGTPVIEAPRSVWDLLLGQRRCGARPRRASDLIPDVVAEWVRPLAEVSARADPRLMATIARRRFTRGYTARWHKDNPQKIAPLTDCSLSWCL
jgi:hypothetical protein